MTDRLHKSEHRKVGHHKVGRRVLATEIAALNVLSDTLGADFDAVVERLHALTGRIILTGVGKSGHVARKIAATLSSTGSPAVYIHPTEASHGDMGMMTDTDALIALSRSGETAELADMLSFCRRFSLPLIAMTSVPDSTLARASDFLLQLPDMPEACSETRAPTTSTTLQIALGDALAVALLEAKGFTAKDFKTFHPGGSLGAALLTVGDIMHTDLPLVTPSTPVAQALSVMSDKGFGCVGIYDGSGLLGMITDGDIRRNLASDLSDKPVTDIMSRNPKTAHSTDMASETLRRMTTNPPKIMQMFVVDEGQPIGIVHLHDFLRQGLA